MANRVTVFLLSKKFGLILLIGSQILVGVLVFISIFLSNFITYSGATAGVYKCDMCGDSTYEDLKKAACSYQDTSTCKLFRGLYNGEIAYLTCASTAVALTIAWVAISIVFYIKKKLLLVGTILGIIAGISQLFGVIAYSILNKVEYSSCSSNYTAYEQPSTCAGDGLKLALAAVILYGVILINYAVFGSRLKRESTTQNVQKVDGKVQNINDRTIIATGNNNSY